MRNKSEAGFSIVDVMIAIVILMVGILALLSAITGAVFQSKGQEKQLNAKQIATSTIESIMSVKETDAARLGWSKVANIGSGNGIFLTDFRQVLTDAGADEILGTADDSGTVMLGFQRRIVITDVCDADRPSPGCNPAGNNDIKIRSVEVTVTYYVGSIQRQEVITTVLTDYSNSEVK